MSELTYETLNHANYVEIRAGIKSISVNKEAVYQIVLGHPANFNEVMKETGLTEKQAYAAIKQLLKEGKIARIMHGGTLFFIKKDNGVSD